MIDRLRIGWLPSDINTQHADMVGTVVVAVVMIILIPPTEGTGEGGAQNKQVHIYIHLKHLR